MKKLTLISTLLFTVTFLQLQWPVASADEFFGIQLSTREEYTVDSRIESLTSAVDGIGALKKLMMYQAFMEGRCEEYFSIETAAKDGDAGSQHFLSDLYNKGYCVPQDDERAFYWVREAAEGGHSDAYFDLGVFLRDGVGTDKNPAAALPWFEKATETRVEAYSALSLAYLYGDGVTENYKKAHEYAHRGAMLGEPTAQAITASIEALVGFDFSDAVDSYKWALIANASGQEIILQALSELTAVHEESLTPSQIEKAQSAALNFTPITLESAPITDPTDIDLPVLDENEVLLLSSSQATARLDSLGLDKDRFLFFKAIEQDNLAVTALYIRAGASPETVSPVLLYTPLQYAAINDSERVARYLVSVGVDINRPTTFDDTPVLFAFSRGNRDIAEFLISNGAKLDHPGIMYNAVQFNDQELLAMLSSKGLPIDQEYVGTPLSAAISWSDENGETRCYEKSAAFLIGRGARLDVQDEWGESMLHKAIGTVNPYDCVKLLLENGVSQAAASHGIKPLFMAIMKGDTEVAELLLEHGADPNDSYALEASDVPMIIVGDAKSAVMNGGSVLQFAVVEQHAAIARLLVRYGADPSASDKLGRTPLSIAAARDDALMISVLRGEM